MQYSSYAGNKVKRGLVAFNIFLIFLYLAFAYSIIDDTFKPRPMLKISAFPIFMFIIFILFSCDEEDPLPQNSNDFRIKEVSLDLGVEKHQWNFNYEPNKVTMDGIITSPDKIHHEVIEYTLDELGYKLSENYIYENYCSVPRAYDYSQPDKIISTTTLYTNYPACDLDDIQTRTYYLNEDKTFNSVLFESNNTTSKKRYRYETIDGNIVAKYNTTNTEYLEGTYTYDLTKEVPENTKLFNRFLSADEFWYGENLIIEYGHLEDSNTYYYKNEYEVDRDGNIIKITRYKSEGDNKNYNYFYTINISYEQIV